MAWILVDVALVVLSLAVLAVVLLGLWRRVKALGLSLGAMSELVAGSADALQVDRPTPPVRRS